MSADPLEGSERARQEFEKWAIDEGWDVTTLNAIDDDVYRSPITQALLTCWQARGRSLEQERDELRARVAELEPLTAFTDALRGKKAE